MHVTFNSLCNSSLRICLSIFSSLCSSLPIRWQTHLFAYFRMAGSMSVCWVGRGKRSSSLFLLIMKLFFLTHIILSPSPFIAQINADYPPTYDECAPYTCGNSTIRYPFGPCGPFHSVCTEDKTIYVRLGEHSSWRVLGDITNSTYSSRTLQIVQDYIDEFSQIAQYDSAYLSSMYDWIYNRENSGYGFNFYLSPGYTAGTIVNCTQQQLLQNGHQIDKNVAALDCGSATNSQCLFFPSNCTSYPIIIPKNYNITADQNFVQLQKIGFQITWSIPHTCNSCLATHGRCYGNGVACICTDDRVHYRNCRGELLEYGMPTVKEMAALFVIGFAVFSIVVVSCIAVRRGSCCFLRTASLEEQSMLAFMEPVDSRPPSVENFLHYYSSQMPTRYSYAQIIAYTNNFSDKVGKGGFGTVYKGKFPSGRLIAVKMLDESKQSEQQFIAEVATVGRTYHVNLVRLLGYCSQVSKRALIYQYMINGSLDKYLHGDHQHELDWKTMHSIAVGTARGIAYLHDECSNRILHCDIKPANVLLDANFLPKVADFGLAKISDREESHISVAKRGTLGYTAPEMWSTEHGPVTDRSDVYSYGMLVMEIVGRRKNIDYDLKSTPSKLFYANWAFTQVEKGEFGNLRKESMSEEDQLIAKRLSLVGLWCLQFNASSRPPISKVIQMLEGGDDIPIPPPPPIPLPVETPQQRCASTQSSSSFALEVKTVNTPEQRCPANQPSSSGHALEMVTINTPLQRYADNQSSSTDALEVETLNPTTTRSANSSRLSSIRRTHSSI